MAIAARMIDMPHRAAGIARLNMTTERCGAAVKNRSPCACLGHRERLRGEIGCTMTAQHGGYIALLTHNDEPSKPTQYVACSGVSNSIGELVLALRCCVRCR